MVYDVIHVVRQGHNTNLPPDLTLSAEDAHSLVRRILAGKVLARSPRLRDLLLDISEHSLSGQPEELSEQAIGVRVFGRAVGYNSTDDNIVRASVRQLRLKLKEYFETEGQNETVLLEIPKGSYVAALMPRAVAPSADPATTAPLRRTPLRAAAAIVVLLCVSYALFRFVSLRVPGEPSTFLGSVLTRNQGPLRVVLTDSALVLMSEMTGRRPTLNEYISGDYARKSAPGLSPSFQQFLAGRQITSLMDVLIVSRLMREYPDAANRMEIRYARHMQTRDFKSGNFIIIGSPASNPWGSLVDSSLNFQFDAGIRVILRNLHPAAGEPAAFESQATGPDYARIALLPNLTGNGFVLLVAGNEAEGTEGAGEFLFRSDSFPKIRKALGVGARDSIPWCEFVLEIKTLQHAARSAEIIAARRH